MTKLGAVLWIAGLLLAGAAVTGDSFTLQLSTALTGLVLFLAGNLLIKRS